MQEPKPIKSKQKASIKDISTLIRGVSEKTIQRELSSLIEAGMVKKATVERVNEKLNAMKAGYSFDEEGEVVIDVNGKFTNDTD